MNEDFPLDISNQTEYFDKTKKRIRCTTDTCIPGYQHLTVEIDSIQASRTMVSKTLAIKTISMGLVTSAISHDFTNPPNASKLLVSEEAFVNFFTNLPSIDGSVQALVCPFQLHGEPMM